MWLSTVWTSTCKSGNIIVIVLYICWKWENFRNTFFPSKVNSCYCESFFFLNCHEVLNWLLMTCMHHYGYSDSSCCHTKSMFSVSWFLCPSGKAVFKISIFQKNRENTIMWLITVDQKSIFPSPIERSWLNISVKRKKTNWQEKNVHSMFNESCLWSSNLNKNIDWRD